MSQELAAPADAVLDELGLRGLVGRKRTDRALALAPEARTEVLLGAGTRAPGQEPDQGDEQVGQGRQADQGPVTSPC